MLEGKNIFVDCKDTQKLRNALFPICLKLGQIIVSCFLHFFIGVLREWNMPLE